LPPSFAQPALRDAPLRIGGVSYSAYYTRAGPWVTSTGMGGAPGRAAA